MLNFITLLKDFKSRIYHEQLSTAIIPYIRILNLNWKLENNGLGITKPVVIEVASGQNTMSKLMGSSGSES